MAKGTPEERFWGKVQKTDGCWLWTAAINTYGYGIFGVSGSRVSNSSGYAYAHRYAYDLLVGPIPEGKQLDHLCRIRHCVRPDHLEPVVVRENIMRGRTHAAANAAKTHCPRGHPYDLVISGRRVCHECKKAANRRWARNAKLRKQR